MKKNFLKLLSLSMLTYASSSLLALDILIYNNDLVTTESKEGKQLLDSFQQKQRSLEDELKKMGENIRKNTEQLQKQAQNAALFSEEKLRKQKSKLDKEIREAERFYKTSQEEFAIERDEKVAELKQKISTYAYKVWEEKKGKLLFDISPSTRKKDGLEAFSKEGDITQDVLKLADASFDTPQKKVEPSKDSKSA